MGAHRPTAGIETVITIAAGSNNVQPINNVASRMRLNSWQ
jgi:hypothetical protein